MDQWFLQLFDLINRQKDIRKVEMLLPELYIEFDILARLENKDGLKDIYYHLIDNDPFNTDDKTYNKNGFIKLKKEILKRLVILNDLTIIEDDAKELIFKGDQKGIKKLLNTWKDHTYVYNYLTEYFEKYSLEDVKKSMAKKKPVKKEIIEEPVEEIIEEVKKELELTPEANPSEVREMIEDKPTKKPTLIKPREIEEPEEILYQGEPLEKETKVVKSEEKPEPTIKPGKEPKRDKKKKKELVKEIPEVKEITTDYKEPIELENKPVVEPVKPEEKISNKPEKVETKEPKIIEEKPMKVYAKDFDGLMDLLTDKYHLTVNKEMLYDLGDPRPNFYRILAEYIDSTDRTASFFIDLFEILNEYKEKEFINYIAGKSNWLRKLCTMNIALINVTDVQKKYKLLDYLKDFEFDFIEKSILEKALRIYFDNLPSNDQMTGKIYGHASKVAALAPKLVTEDSVYESIDFFNKKVISNSGDIDYTNPTQLYWSIILATCLTIYVQRFKDYDFTNSMNCIKNMSIKLINLTEDQFLRDSMVTLFKSYIRSIYKFGTKAPGYEEWWKGQTDSMLDAKLDAIGELNLID